MSNVLVGTNGLIEQPSSYGFTQGKGAFTKRSWKVTDSSHLTTLLPYLSSIGFSYEVTNGQFITVDARAEAESNGDNANVPLSDIWERSTNVSEKDILDSNLSTVESLTLSEREILRETIATGKPPIWLTLSANAISIGELILAGVKSKITFQPIIKHTYVTANNYTVKWADTNVGRIVSVAQMTSFEGCPSTVLFNLPTETSLRAAMLAGFLKKPANIQQIAGGQWQISQEYDFGLWADFLYDPAT